MEKTLPKWKLEKLYQCGNCKNFTNVKLEKLYVEME